MRDACPRCFYRDSMGDRKCFRCGYYKKIKYLRRDKSILEKKIFVPEDTCPLLSDYATLYLWQFYLGVSDQIRYNIKYSPSFDALVLKQYDSDWQLVWCVIKRLNPEKNQPKTETYGNYSSMPFFVQNKNSTKLVIVEDFLSCCVVGKFENCLCLNGTSINSRYIKSLIAFYDEIIFWLDPDVAGQAGTIKSKDKLAHEFKQINSLKHLLSLPVINYKIYKACANVYDKDPKYHYQDLIKTFSISCDLIYEFDKA